MFRFRRPGPERPRGGRLPVMSRKVSGFMLSNTCRLLSGLLLLGGGWFGSASAAPLAPGPEHGRIAMYVSRRLPQEHLLRMPLDNQTSARAWTNYFSALDFERVYFLESDLERFRSSLWTIDDELREGNVQLAYEVFHVFRERVRERLAYVSGILESGFDLERDEVYRWKRRHAPWPADREQQDELWRLRIKNEYVRRRLALETDSGSTDGGLPPDNPDDEEEPDTGLDPEEAIRKRYERFLTVLEDSDADWVLERYLTAVIQAYDPHSLYMSGHTLEDFSIEMKLSLFGIGALLSSEDGAAKIVRLIPGGPADRDVRDIRLQPGDKIIAVAQEDEESVDVLHWPLSRIVRLIRGPKGSRVVLTVIPASDPTETATKAVDLIRDEVKLEEQAARWELHPTPGRDDRMHQLAVITVPAFYANLQARSPANPDFRSSAYDVRRILGHLVETDVEGVVLDLRNNGGGSLLEAIRMTGLFIPGGPVVQVKEQNRYRLLQDPDPNLVYDGPLLVLVNRLSASATEILAGALQDYHRAVVVGDSKTHGKGTVQTLLNLDAGGGLGALKVTNAKYYRISGHSTQLHGVEPDIVISSPFDFMEFGEDHLPNAIPWSTVDAVDYTPLGNLDPLLPTLRERSLQRRENDGEFQVYTNLLQRIARLNQSDALPLHIERRRELVHAERDLADPRVRFATRPGETNRQDLVLSESLKILSDLVILWDQMERPDAGRRRTPVNGGFDGLWQWLRQRL